MQALLGLDGNILLFIQDNLRFPALTPVMRAITTLGNAGIFWIILTIALLLFPKTRKTGVYSIAAMVLSLLFNNMLLKHLVGRIRPYEVVSGLELLVAKADDASFPSGHSAVSFASAVAIYRAKQIPKAVCVALFVLAGLIAYSRLYVGIHYPTDVIVGVIMGILCGYFGAKIGEAIIKKVHS